MCPTIFMASYVVKIPIKSIFNLISVAGEMLAGASSHILAPRDPQSTKLTIVARNHSNISQVLISMNTMRV